ncbi:response regulator transcription factor [Paenibacillus dokdonensis]|uniref:response regulator transcription factor n=1 Tax=Paenibacillus dokdonensis TaxID=2567944 RepID=UPI0010A7C111|nr:response regulator transcription factor [Paenibacillus dokdonensis]
MYKVFLVDDEPFIVEGLYSILDWSDYQLEIIGSAENGKEALASLQEHPADILITDITMPEMTGLELIREARALFPDLKIIILSGYNEFNYVKEGMKYGIENYLLKPINVEELKQTLKSTVDKIQSTQAQTMAHQDMDILRSNILNRWVSGQIEHDELLERGQLLSLEIPHECYETAVIKPMIPPSPQHEDLILYRNEKLEQVYQRVRSMTEHDELAPGICFVDWDSDIVVVFGYGSSEDQDTVEAAFNQLMDQLRIIYPFELLVSMGELQSGLDGAAESYRDAKRVQQFFLISPHHLILTNKRVEELKNQSGSSIHVPDWGEYSRLLLSLQQEELLQRIENDLDQLSSTEGITPYQVQNRVVEMIIWFKQAIKEANLPDPEEAEGYKSIFAGVFSSLTMGELKKQVMLAAENVMAYLQGQQSLSPVVKQVLTQIHEHYADELSLKLLGQEYNINAVYLGQLFHRETGKSLSDYVNSYRIEKAKELLKRSNLKVQEVARMTGYLDNSYFFRQFKKYVGVSPAEFKGLV